MKILHLELLLFFVLSIVSIFLFLFDAYVDISITIFLLMAITLYVFTSPRLGDRNFSKIVMVVFLAPFVHLYEYLGDDGYTEKEHAFGLLMSNPYSFVQPIIESVGSMAVIGALGLLIGFLLGVDKRSRIAAADKPYQPLPIAGYLFFILLSLFFAYIDKPTQTIAEANYTASVNLIEQAGISFNGAWLLSYVLLAVAYIDSLLSHHKRKKYLFYTALLLESYWQFSTGNREIIGFYLFLLVMNIYRIKNKKNIIYLLGLALVLLAVSQIVGALRSIATDKNALEMISLMYDNFHFNRLIQGTWSAVCLTPLSVAGDYYNGLLNFKYGSTYLDYALSLPPSFLADLVGYTRPINGLAGPAWEMRYGIGGTHALVVPFMNFGIFGVFFIMMLYGWFLSKIESRMKNNNFYDLLLISVFCISILFWFWYGEMYMVRGLMAYMFAAALYFVFVKIRLKRKIG